MLTEGLLSLPTFHTSSQLPYILDDTNRARFFRGANFVNKGFPWYPEVLRNETNIELLADMGFNTVRLGFMWTGAQPEQFGYNETYFENMKEIVQKLAKHEIYAFLDVHQDVMSSYYCLYDGFPKWAVNQSPNPKHEFPWPLEPGSDGNPCRSGRQWGRNYFSEACSVAFQSLYEENSPLQQSFWAFWQKTAEYFRDLPILGYEIINEPWAGDIYSDPALLLPGNAGAKNLLPFYDIMARGIREKDPNHLIFYEPVTWGMIFNGNLTGSGFDHVPGGAEFASSSVFSFHYYCWWYQDPENDFTRETCDRLFGPKVFEQAIHETKKLGGATMLTEWGQGCGYDSDDPYNPQGECHAIMDLGDKFFVSWTDWYFGEHLNKVGFPLTENAQRIFSRTSARIIAGRPKHMSYDVVSRKFELCFEFSSDDGLTSPITEVYVPFKLQYPNGITIQTKGNLELISTDEAKNKVLFKNKRVTLSPLEKEHVCLSISSKDAKEVAL
jgi:endoglycosylceramidase